MLDLLLITAVVCYIIDISGITDTFKKVVWKTFAKGVGDYHTLELKPFTCSLCMTFWCGIIYLLITSQFTLPYIAYVSLLSMLSSKISDIEIYVLDVCDTLIQLLYKIIN